MGCRLVNPNRVDDTVRRYVESLGLALSRIGLKRMPARVLAALVVSRDGRLTAGELASWLAVSPAAVSGAVRHLERIELVAQDREPGERRVGYRIGDDLWYATLFEFDHAAVMVRDAAENGISSLGADSPAGQRMAELRDFLSFTLDELNGMRERWVTLRTRNA